MSIIYKIFFSSLLLIAFFTGNPLFTTEIIYAASLHIGWNANPEGDISGYRLYCGTSSYNYGSSVDVGNVTDYIMPDLVEGVTYYIALSALDTSQNESAICNEISAIASSPEVTTCPWDPSHANYCLDCGPCPEGQGDCDNDSECQSGLVCAQDVGADYGWDSSIDVCEYPGNTNDCPWDPSHANYCLDCGPCPEGQGDCDNDSECQSGLVCAQDVGADYGWDSSIDVCEYPGNTNDCPWDPSHANYCLDCGPCPEGQGDCDNDSECQSGLVCAQDVGADYGWDSSIDVCEYPGNTNDCPWDPSHANYCLDCGPCPEGQGDCDNDSECQSGLVCTQDVGAFYGWDSSIDVCEYPGNTNDCPWDPSHANYCLDCGPCPEGQGDCDNDSECQSGLVCAQDVGAGYGWDSSIDVCECPWNPGHANYCLDCGPCPEGQGDCDNDNECRNGLVCVQDVGTDYGWDSRIDVCEYPWNPVDTNECPLNPGHPDYCLDCGPCPEGRGDCDNDSECQSGLVCAQDVGADYGWNSSIDVCECPWDPSHPDYCLDCGPCPEGRGDCDNDSECQSGLVCAQDVGAGYGWDASIDVCECPWNPGHPDYCLDCGPCPEGQGDCDNDSECQSGLVCAQDVGAGYGWDSSIDVCEMP